MPLSKQELIEAVSQGLEQKDFTPNAVAILKKATETVLLRVQQNVDAQFKEDSYPIIEKFCKTVANKLTGITQKWADGVTNDLVVFPEGTRYIHRDGNITSIVVEQQPQNRHITIDGRVRLLAMPYVQFIIHFNGDAPTQSLTVSFTKKPLSDLDERVFSPIIPNISQQHTVCWGSGTWPKKGTMTDKVNDIITQFWSSSFTDSLIDGYQSFLRLNNLTLQTWEQRSKVDPTFVLHKNTKYEGTMTTRALMEQERVNGAKTALVTTLKTEIVNSVGAIGAELAGIMGNLDVQTENRDKVHLDVLKQTLREIVLCAYSELHEYNQKMIQEERTKLYKELEDAAQKMKNDFETYMNSRDKTKKRVW